MILQNKEKQAGENNSQFAYRVIRENIMCLTLPPGYAINESDFCDQLEISRTPIREALSKLRDERLVNIFPQRLTCVSQIDFRLSIEGQALRAAVEPKIMRDAAGKLSPEIRNQLEENLELQRFIADDSDKAGRFFDLDNEFHRLIYMAADRLWTWELLKIAATHLDRVRYINVLRGNFRSEHIYADHLKFFKVLTNEADESFEKLVEEHFWIYEKGGQAPEKKNLESLFKDFPEYKEYFVNLPF